MTRARPGTQTTCDTERRTSTCAIREVDKRDLTLCGSTCADAGTRSASDGGIITGTSATHVASAGDQFQFSMPGNGWATVDYVP